MSLHMTHQQKGTVVDISFPPELEEVEIFKLGPNPPEIPLSLCQGPGDRRLSENVSPAVIMASLVRA